MESITNSKILMEIRGVICSFLHQMFIDDPSLIKLVHFQGYPRELLPVTCVQIPSMLMCLDFAAELLEEPELQKKIFIIDLISYISQQHRKPESHSVAHLIINTMQNFLSELTHDRRRELYLPILPALVRIIKVFPNLKEDCLTFLNRLSSICNSVLSVRSDILLLHSTQSSEEIDVQKLNMRIVRKPDLYNESSDVAVANQLFARYVNQVVKDILSIV